MKLARFIAKKIAFDKGKSFTKVIIGIAVSAIAISMTVMILSTATITGFKKEINEKIFGFWGHIHISDSNNTRNFEPRAIEIDQNFYQEIIDIEAVEYQKPTEIFGVKLNDKYTPAITSGGVKHVQPIIIAPGLLETKENFHTILFKGVNEDYSWRSMDDFLISGNTLEGYGEDNGIMVSSAIANTLDLKVDDNIITAFVQGSKRIRRRMKIVGIYNTGLEEYDKRFVIGDMGKLQELLEWQPNQAASIEIIVDDVEDSEVISDYIYNTVLPMNLYAETIQEKFPSLFEWLKFQDLNEQVILSLMAVVSIVNMITVFLILILERTKMIGLLKALGAQNKQIKNIFLYYAALIILAGQLIGNIIGLSVAYIQKVTRFIKLDESSYYLDAVPIHIDWGAVIFINILAFVVTLLSLIIPALLVARITPIKALRFN